MTVDAEPTEPPIQSEKPRARYKITVAYRGTRYHGWQRQATPPNWKGTVLPGWGIPTVQQSVERALVDVVKHRVAVIGASRTDSGVHARAQVAHFDTEYPQIAPERLRYAINAKLPGDVVITSIVRVPNEFHSIKWAIEKRYEYLVRNHLERDAFDADTSFWRAAVLDVDAMQRAASCFIGTHDFKSFCRPGHKRFTTTRTISNCHVERRGDLVAIGVEGNGFLWNQVRIMAGTLIDIGLGIYPPDSIPEMLAA
ncbi:MAG TPA: tRNA pseudouridine(38-40) synthase TruA, partial [Tepidisphaeraceae bacterium]|nr:tRNA pseudouridine(38-40) synthase TruA [Tepidisphaeraceae bacterium]